MDDIRCNFCSYRDNSNFHRLTVFYVNVNEL